PPAGIAVVAIHGIGDLAAGSVLLSTAKTLEKIYPQATVTGPPLLEEGTSIRTDEGQIQIHQLHMRWQDQPLDLYEFNWATAGGKIRLLNPVGSVWKILGLIVEFPRMAIDTTTSTGLKFIVRLAGWLQWGLALLCLI